MQWSAGVFEFGATWLLIQKDGKVSKEDLRQVYDVSNVSPLSFLDFASHANAPTPPKGSIFWRIREARQNGKGWDKGFGIRDLVALGNRKLKL